MNSNTANKIISLIFLADLVVVLVHLSNTLSVWTPITDYYAGSNLILFFSKISVHFLLGISVIIILFLSHMKLIKILLPIYIGEIFLAHYWQIEPNTEKYKNLIEALKQSYTTSNTDISNVEVVVNSYPYTFVYVFYIFSIIYVYLVMGRLPSK